jgi:hypothetical protein
MLHLREVSSAAEASKKGGARGSPVNQLTFVRHFSSTTTVYPSAMQRSNRDVVAAPT